jgi:uncharacterized protein
MEVKMKKGLVIITGLVLVSMMVGVAGCDTFSSSGPANIAQAIQSNQNIGISVTGTGEVVVTPDIAVVNIGVQVQMGPLADAQQQAADSMTAIMAALDRHNIAKKDIQTSYYSIQPVWTWKDNEYVLKGYSVSNNVKVKIRNIDDTGSIIDDVVVAGEEYVIINGINFTMDNPENYYKDARTAAMADAKDKATQLAKSSGVKIGPPLYFNEGMANIARSSDTSNIKIDATATTSISSGELKVTITVQVVYSIA